MAWVQLQYKIEKVNLAGKRLIDPDRDDIGIDEALDIISNWRSCHSFPLHTHYVRLRKYTDLVDKNGLVARRLKRLSSIEAKLYRFKNMKLSQMQDIGGCRAIVSNIPKLNVLIDSYKESSRKHDLVHEDNYIKNPQSTGYRGVHLVYRYKSDKNQTYNGRKVEIQLRSYLQHTWATAVEIYGTLTNQTLKSNRGEHDWLRFFSLMGSVVALRERSPIVPDTPNDSNELKSELRDLVKKLNVLNILEAYGSAIETSLANASNADLFLINLNPHTKNVSVTGYLEKDLEKASYEYMQAEKLIKNNPQSEVVLVAVESIQALRKAYPNYFLDTKGFLQIVSKAIK